MLHIRSRRARLAAAAVSVLALAVAAPHAPRAHAEPAAGKPAATPSSADLDKAKKAFAEGKKLFDAKRYAEAVEKFKESYRLSRNPLLLYNVGVTFDQKGDKDLALFYYKKFLTDAPPTAAQRGEVSARVKELEAQHATADSTTTTGAPDGTPSDGVGSASGSAAGSATDTTGAGSATDAAAPDTATSTGTSTTTTSTTAGSDTPDGDLPATHARAAHAGPFTATDFEHQLVDSAPPGKPLDLTAYAPEGSGWQVTLYFRGAGDATFTQAPMRPHYHELVARIPAARMTGASVQYYLEVRDAGGAVVTRVGRSSSPNLVYLDDTAKPRFFPDLDDGDTGTAALAATPATPAAQPTETPTGTGFFDPGSSRFERAKWGSTVTAAGLFTVSIAFYLVASSAASSLEGDAARSQSDCNTPPCSTYDSDLKTIDSRGRGFATMTNVAFFLGLAATGAAGYFWYEDRTHHRAEHAAAGSRRTFIATPVVGDGLVGAAAALQF